ncbi:uncharacterized protein TrAFT101_000368 [Trichoderma asperellum]|uniref:uncharacterized protein n=1 Tax=Trichoderma asperellum TaxID=101201 RepID=UPI0033186EBA|nr:hypothetical protein TrAFT101_000368 [Trichoderma asperellum]
MEHPSWNQKGTPQPRGSNKSFLPHSLDAVAVSQAPSPGSSPSSPLHGRFFHGISILTFPKHVKMPLILAPDPAPIGQGASMGG